MKTRLFILYGLFIGSIYSGQGKIKKARRQQNQYEKKTHYSSKNKAFPFIAAASSFIGVKSIALTFAGAASFASKSDLPIREVMKDEDGIIFASQLAAGLASWALIKYF